MSSENEAPVAPHPDTSREQLSRAYDSWAASEGDEMVGRFGYVAHIVTGHALREVVEPPDPRILDAGCGAGLVGEVLAGMGFKNIDALDCARHKLNEAGQKEIYRGLLYADMNQPLDIEDNAYDAVVCADAFTSGKTGAGAFEELIRVTKPGGHICFTIPEGALDEDGYISRMNELEKSKAWQLVSMTEEDYLRNEGAGCRLYTYRVSGGAPS